MKKLFPLICAIFALFYFGNIAEAKTVAKETAGSYTISVTRKHGKTAVKWNGETICKFRFKGKVRIVGESKLTGKMLRKRKNKTLYIERIVGKVRNNKGDGLTTCGNYISYRTLKGKVKPGDIVITYCVYNPFTKWIDDVIERYDAIL